MQAHSLKYDFILIPGFNFGSQQASFGIQKNKYSYLTET